jgi:hypothetical protein
MGAISKWLMHDEQKGLIEVLVACVLNILFLVLSALLLWALGRPTLVFRLAKGYGILWPGMLVTFVLLTRLQRLFRVNIYDHPNAYVISNLVVSCLWQAGWAAFIALAVHSTVAGASGLLVVLLYLIGGLSCLVAFFAVSSFYQGEIYKLISLPLALLGFIVFSVWPASGRALFGWFFALFGVANSA